MLKKVSLFAVLFFTILTSVHASNEDAYSQNIIDSLEQLVSASEDLRDKGQYYLEMAKEHAYMRRYAEAIIEIDNAIICAEKIEDHNFLAQCLIRKTYIFINSSNDVSIRAKKIAPIIEELVELLDKVYLPISRASIYTLQGIQVEIEHNYDDSEEMFTQLIHFQKKAIAELDKQQDTLQGMDLISDRNYKKLEISSALIDFERFDEAFTYLNEVLESPPSRKNANTTLFVKMLANQLLIEANYAMDNSQDLSPLIDSCLFYAQALPDLNYDNYRGVAYELIHQILFEMGDFQKAYEVQQLYFNLREQDFNESEILAQGKAESNLKMVKDSINQAQILIDKNNKIEATSRQNTWLATVAILLFVGAVVFFFLMRKIQGDKRVIEKQNQQVNEALYEKGLLLKEVHHRVKNNMQLVSSLLELQSEFATDEFAKKVLSEANDRIKALALSHQNLYQNEDYENIELNEYFDQIIYFLLAQVNVETQINIPDHYLINIERGQVLGFIVNELIINSLKYAWKDKIVDKRITLSIQNVGDDIEFTFSDNGSGFPSNFSLEKSNSLGYTLIPSFVKRQLKGTIHCDNKEGANIKIIFPHEI